MILENQVELNQLIADKKGIRLKIKLGNIPLLSVDKNAMIQVIDNFISNAIKFSPPDSRIDIGTDNTGNGIRFWVRDQGPGISSEDQKLLFGEFQTLSAKPTGGEKSTGLGLAIVKKIINLHGGKVGVSSDPGKGCTFYFTIPPDSNTNNIETSNEPRGFNENGLSHTINLSANDVPIKQKTLKIQYKRR